MKSVYPVVFIFSLLIFSCSPRGSEKTGETFFNEDSVKMINEASEVIYSLSLPTDMSYLLEKSGFNFMPELLSSTENASRYTDTSQIAVILGIYGVDLSYAKIYNQAATVADYYNMLKVLSNRLGVPETIFSSSRTALENAFNNPDSLTSVIKNIYQQTDGYFRSTGQDYLASVSLMGGWIEAMYIGVNLYQTNGSREMRERILQQQFALSNMISLLSNYHNDEAVTGYLLMLKKLRAQFDKIEIRYAKEGFSVDTVGHKFQSTGAVIKYDPATVDQICRIIIQIRNELIG
ncbi:MAG: hypothetical protein ACOYXB_15800 [Bacteroidota bacterium]